MYSMLSKSTFKNVLCDNFLEFKLQNQIKLQKLLNRKWQIRRCYEGWRGGATKRESVNRCNDFKIK